jgi:hypothetical protein
LEHRTYKNNDLSDLAGAEEKIFPKFFRKLIQEF